MRYVNYVPLVLSIVTFLLVFNFFYSLAPVFIPFTIEDVYKYAPNGYVYPSDKPDKIVAHYTTYNNLRVFEYWYHWSYDGYEKRDDWEPVVVYVNDDTVHAVAFRIHYNWRVIYSPPVEDGTHVRITFGYLWHTPTIVQPPKGYVKVDLKPVIGQPPETLDHDKIIGIPSPFESAFVSAVTYATISAVVVYFVSSFTIRRFKLT